MLPGTSRVGWAPSRIVPPLSVIVFCSSSRQMTGWGVSLSNSVELARCSPSTLRANSATAHCMPRQMPKKGMPRLAGEADGVDLALDAPLAEPARHEDAVHAGQQSFGPFALDGLAVDPLDADLRPVMHAGMVEGLVDRLVGVAVLGVLAHHGDA